MEDRHGRASTLLPADAADPMLFRALFDTAHIGMLVADADLTIRHANWCLGELTGRQAGELVGITLGELLVEDDLFSADPWATDFVADLRPDVRRFADAERQLQRPDGTRIWVRINITVHRSADGSEQVFAQIVEIDSYKTVEAQLREDQRRLHVTNREFEWLATHDSLTGLPNRSLLMDRLEVGLARLARTDNCLTLFYVDLDGFKNVNDCLGHHGGDELLVAVARELDDWVRPADTVARVGGDEFVIICHDIGTPQHAAAIADRVAHRLRRPVPGADPLLVVTASIGYVICDSGSESPERLIQSADEAMYLSKRIGRPVLSETSTAPTGDRFGGPVARPHGGRFGRK